MPEFAARNRIDQHPEIEKDFIRRVLEEERYAVTVTADGISAVQLAETDHFDLIKNLLHDEAPVWVVLPNRRTHFEPIGQFYEQVHVAHCFYSLLSIASLTFPTFGLSPFPSYLERSSLIPTKRST
jgi:hypothetical protein